MILTPTEREYCTEAARRMAALATPLSLAAADVRARGEDDDAATIDELAFDLRRFAARVMDTIRPD